MTLGWPARRCLLPACGRLPFLIQVPALWRAIPSRSAQPRTPALLPCRCLQKGQQTPQSGSLAEPTSQRRLLQGTHQHRTGPSVAFPQPRLLEAPEKAGWPVRLGSLQAIDSATRCRFHPSGTLLTGCVTRSLHPTATRFLVSVSPRVGGPDRAPERLCATRGHPPPDRSSGTERVGHPPAWCRGPAFSKP